MFENEIERYGQLAKQYGERIVSTTHPGDLRQRHEILFSAHSCGIEGNSFTVGDTKELKEKGLGVIPQGKTLLEAFEMLDHFKAYEFLMSKTGEPLTEQLVKETHRLLTLNTLAYRAEGAVPGEYTDTDMCAGETVFGDHETLVARVPKLLESTQQAIEKAQRAATGAQGAESLHPVVIAARFHGYFEYLHPFRDGNGRLGRLLSNFILAKLGQPMLVIEQSQRAEYITALDQIRTEGTDEHLVAFFFRTAINRMERELSDKAANTRRSLLPFLF